MKQLYSRAANVPVPSRSVRRSIKFSCGKGGLREAMTRFGRSYGLVNDRGVPRDGEICRLLLVVALTSRDMMGPVPNRVAAALQIVLTVQQPFLVSTMFRTLAHEYATVVRPGQRRTGRTTAERMRTARVTMDDWLHDSCNNIAVRWQDDIGRVHDTKMMADLCYAGISDRDLPAIAAQYVELTARLRANLTSAEAYCRAAVADALNLSGKIRRAG